MKYLYRVQYNDVDTKMRLRPYVLESWILDTAGQASETDGVGLKYLSSLGLVWVITSLNAELHYMPTIDETIEIESWVEENAHRLTLRNFRITMGKEQIGLVKSTWAIIDLKTRASTDVFWQRPFLTQPLGETIRLNRTRHSCLANEDDYAQGSWEHQIEFSEIDFNRHCNSCKYMEFMFNAFHYEAPLKGFSIRYAHELFLGERIRVDWCHSNSARKTDYKVLFLPEDIDSTPVNCCTGSFTY